MFKKDCYVKVEHSDHEMGSEGLDVLSTPSLIAFIVNIAKETVHGRLTDKEITVGIEKNIKHKNVKMRY